MKGAASAEGLAGPSGERPAPSSTLGMAEVHLALGQVHLDRGDPAGAYEWFRAASLAGDARAFNMLGRCHDMGWGVPPDPAIAARYFHKAADLGDVWALFNLADLHCHGRGVVQDDMAAYRLYLAAARRGHLKALNMLGLFHECGRAVPADAACARQFFHAAAEGGDCWGCFNHARLLIARGTMDAALPWLERALQAGFPDFHAAMADALEGQDDPRLQALRARAAACARRAGNSGGAG